MPLGAWLDTILYGTAAAFSALAARFWSNPLQQEWARAAVWAYLAGALLSLAVAALSRRLPERRHVVLRTVVLFVVLGGATAGPLVANVRGRAESGPATHAQSETIIIEEAARQLLAGRDPYVATYLRGPLRTWPTGTKTHFPYLPGMLLFGMPRAIGLDGAAGDSRVWLTGVSVLATLAALRVARASASAWVLALQVLLILPTGASPIAGGGDDVTVLAVMLLALVLARNRSPVVAGLALGLAGAMKQTAWLLAPFLILAARHPDGRRARGPALAGALAVTIPAIVPFVVWNPTAFFEDVILFPLGIGQEPTLAQAPTLGRLLRDVLPGSAGLLAAMAVVVIGAAAAYLMTRAPSRSAAQAARHAALVAGVAVMLSTAGRFGYLAYPIVLTVWAFAVLSEDAREHPQEGFPEGLTTAVG